MQMGSATDFADLYSAIAREPFGGPDTLDLLAHRIARLGPERSRPGTLLRRNTLIRGNAGSGRLARGQNGLARIRCRDASGEQKDHEN